MADWKNNEDLNELGMDFDLEDLDDDFGDSEFDELDNIEDSVDGTDTDSVNFDDLLDDIDYDGTEDVESSDFDTLNGEDVETFTPDGDVDIDLDDIDDDEYIDTDDAKPTGDYLDNSEDELDSLLDEINTRKSRSNDSGSDLDIGEIRSDSLMDEPEYESNPPSFDVAVDNNFISSNGDIVVMDPSDDGNSFKLVYIDIEHINLAGKRIRSSNNVDDLITSIKSTGLLNPIAVAPLMVAGEYVLLDGFRRLIACAKAGKRNIPCIVNTKIKVQEIPILEAMYNHNKKYTIKEMIDYIDYLEKQKGIMSSSLIEYLLQMNSGEYSKLKDILNDDDDDIVSRMMDGMCTIEEAFKKLERRRSKESKEEKDSKRAKKALEINPDKAVEEIEDSGERGDDGVELTDEEISKLSINASDLDEVDDEDLSDLIEEGNDISGFEPHKQDPKYRERLDPTLRKSIIARDNNTCQVCKQISGMEYTEVLDVHHITEVYFGGKDDKDNLITACTVCHKLVHLYGRGELNIRPLAEMSEVERAKFKRIAKLGNVIRKDMAAKGMKIAQLKELDRAETIGRTKPGTGQVAG